MKTQNILEGIEASVHTDGTAAVQDSLDRAGNTLAGGGRRITQAARTTAGATDRYVRESPWQAVGIAALGGALIGYLLSRR